MDIGLWQYGMDSWAFEKVCWVIKKDEWDKEPAEQECGKKVALETQTQAKAYSGTAWIGSPGQHGEYAGKGIAIFYGIEVDNEIVYQRRKPVK